MEPSHRLVARGTLSMIGTIIGAGVFGIAPMFTQVGLLNGSVVFWSLALVVLATHLLYIEIIRRDPKPRRFPGHVGIALGPRAKMFAVLTHIAHLVGANLAYLILGGEFLSVIATALHIWDVTFLWQLIFWCVGALTVLFGFKLATRLESGLTWALIAMMLFIVALAVPDINLPIGSLTGTAQPLASLGIVLFALFGLTVIPEVHDITGHKVKLTRRAVVLGSLIAALLIWLFGAALFAAPELLTDTRLSVVLALVGFLAVITSYITSTLDLQAMVRLDLKSSAMNGWYLALGAPLVLLFITSRDYLATVSVVGALFTALTGILVVLSATALMERDRIKKSIWWRVIVPIIAAGAFMIAIVQRLLSFALH